jgi:uncharacterized protein (DUF427 family)
MKPRRIEPGPGQESVWDYPRPPRVEPSKRHVRIEFAGEVIADSSRALRVCETAGPPVLYVPPEDVQTDLLVPSPGHTTFCEWKGTASYVDIVVGSRRSDRAAWTYEAPASDFAELKGYLAFYPGRVDAAFLDDENVRPQPGEFYGGWITNDIVGPFKGEPGSGHW